MSKSGSNTITGTSASEHLNGGSGADIINGMGGNDRINAGSGNDIMDGGAGNDIVNGDAGDDLGIYVLSDNIGSTDVYDGGSGRDTLQLVLTREQWQSPAVQADIARFLVFLAEVTHPVNGQANNRNFTFSFGLTVSKFEALQVLVDGVSMDPRDEAVTLVDDVMSVDEDSVSASVDVLANDSVPDLIASLTHTDPAHGSVTLTRTNGAPGSADTASFIYTPSATYWQYLAAGETATDTFTYTVTDSDGDTRTATVTVTITGTNDAPTISSAVSSGAVVENGVVVASGEIGFADVDLSDTHTATSMAGAPDYLGTFTTTVTDNGAGDGAGSVTWNFSVDDAAIQYLAAGETVTQSYTVTVDDGQGGTVSQPVAVTITGTNDAPTIIAAVSSGAVVEDGVTSAAGAIAFADVDLRDSHTVSSTADGSGYLGTFTATVTDDGSNDGAGSVSWNFAVDNAAIQYLAAGQTLTQTYTVVVDDGNGGTVSQPVTVTITGTNDAPVITSADRTGGVAEAEPVTGVVAATTPVLADTETNNSFATAQLINRSDLRIAAGNTNLADPTDPSVRIQGAISTSADQDVFRIDLQPGETLTLDIDFAGIIPGVGGLDSFVFLYDAAGNLLNFNDDSSTSVGGGGSTSTMDSFLQFVATLGGTYYIVVKDFDLFGQSSAGTYALNVSVDSQNLLLTDTGAMTFADVDLSDGHTVSVAAGGDGYLGGLTAVVSNASTNDGAGAVQWTFSVANAAVQFLAAGETRTQSYVVTVNDGQGGTASETVTVTITGENDRPTISTAFSSGQVVENAALSASGVIAFDDVDLIDGHSVSSAADGTGYLGNFSASITDPATGAGAGEITWSFNASDAELQYLAAGQSLLQRYIVTVDDGNGGTTQQLVNITITGTNDAPTITAAVSNGAVVEDGVTSAGGAIAFNDVDLRDGHTVASTANGAGYVGAFNAAVTDNGAGDGAGSVEWNFSVDNAAIQYLAAGETLTQSYTVTVSDGQGGTVDQIVTVTLTGTNDAPVVQGVSAAAAEDGAPVTIAFSADDVDSDDDAGTLTYAITSAPAEGSVVNNGDGTFSFDPGADFQDLAAGETRQIIFGYEAADAHGATTPGSVTITVTGTNDAPVTGDVELGGTSVGAGFPLVFGGYYTYAAYNQNSGEVVFSLIDTNGDGVVDAPGSSSELPDDGQTYDVHYGLAVGDVDGDGDVDVVVATNQGLVSYTNVGDTNGDGQANFVRSVLSNGFAGYDVALGDLDGDGRLDVVASRYNTLTELLNTGDANGDGLVNDFAARTVATGAQGNAYGISTADMNGDGLTDVIVANYWQGPNQILLNQGDTDGDGQINYRVQNLSGAYNTNGLGVITGDVDGDGDLDLLVSRWSGQNEVLYINDGDSDGDGLINFRTIELPTGGSTLESELIDIDGDGDLDVVTAEVSGNARIAYNQGDSNGDGLVEFSIQNVTGASGNYGVAVGDVDGDGDLDIVYPSTSQGASVYLQNQGDTDGDGQLNFARVALTGVDASWDAEFTRIGGGGGGSGAYEDGPVVTGSFDGDDVDSDDDGASLTYTITSAPSEGSVVNNGDGTFGFSPGDDFQDLAQGETRTVTFTYTATDAHGAVSEPSTVTIRVAGTNDAPVAVIDTVSGTEDASVTINVLANDTDVDGETLTVTHVNGANIAVNGTVALGGGASVRLNADGTLTYVPAANATGVQSFSYTVSDGMGGSATSTVEVDLAAVNDAPVGRADAASTDEDTALVLTASNLLDNDTDVDGDSLSISSVSAVSARGASVSINAAGDVVYDPGASAELQALSRGQQVADTFTYVVTDPSGATSTATVTITVDGRLEAPIANPDTVTVTENGTVSGNVVTNDVVTGSTGDSGNVLVNGSFEQGNPVSPGGIAFPASLPGWTSVQGSFEVWGTGFGGNTASDGIAFLELDNGGGQDAYSSNLTTDVGREYTLNFDLAIRNGTSPSSNRVEFFVNGVSLGVFTPPSTTFTTFIVTFIGSGTDVITFREPASANDGVGGLIDNLRISAPADVFVTAVNGDAGAVGDSVAGSDGGAFVVDANGDYTFNAGTDFDYLAAGETATSSVTYTVTDAGGSSTATATVTITGEDDAPVVSNALADQSGDMLAPFSYTLAANAFTDVDSDLTLSATLANGDPLPSWLSFNAATRTFSGTPQGADTGQLEVRVTATGDGQSASDVFQLDVNVIDQTFIGGAGNDTLNGDVGDDTIVGGNGGDTLNGGAGDDVISGDAQNVSGVAGPGEAPLTTLAASYYTANHNLVTGLGGPRGFGEGVFARNDDGSMPINITSVFGAAGLDFFGNSYTTLFLNNNGNITFNSGFYGYNPSSISAGIGNPLIAAFWTDIDTRNAAGQTSPGGTSQGTNQVYYDLDAVNGVLTFTWDDVGQYSNGTVPNAFQIQLISRGNGDFDIIYRYEDINWGANARAGYNSGTGTSFEFAQSGTAAMLNLEGTVGNTGIAGVYVFNVRDGVVSTANNDVIDGGAGMDRLIGGLGDDDFIFHAGQANGDVIVDFIGNGAAAGDELVFRGYGTAAEGATFVQLDATHWQINSADGTIHDVITIENGATIHSTDWEFLG